MPRRGDAERELGLEPAVVAFLRDFGPVLEPGRFSFLSLADPSRDLRPGISSSCLPPGKRETIVQYYQSSAWRNIFD